MSSPSVLALPDFNKTFIIETDASETGMGPVLMQEGHHISYISKAFSEKNALLSAYERELLAIVFAVHKWQHYLMTLSFIIRTDQQSLKHLLEHKLATPFQQKWLSKLADFDYSVEYKSGRENKVADALSRVPGMQLLTMAVTSVQSQLMKELENHWSTNPHLVKLINELQTEPSTHPQYSWCQNKLMRKGKLVIGSSPEIRKIILDWMHSSGYGGHSGIHATLKRIQTLFFWHDMKNSVIAFIKHCPTCQKCKYDQSAYPGLLQPLPMPVTVCE